MPQLCNNHDLTTNLIPPNRTGAERIELPQTGLESIVLPLYYAPKNTYIPFYYILFSKKICIFKYKFYKIKTKYTNSLETQERRGLRTLASRG